MGGVSSTSHFVILTGAPPPLYFCLHLSELLPPPFFFLLLAFFTLVFLNCSLLSICPIYHTELNFTFKSVLFFILIVSWFYLHLLIWSTFLISIFLNISSYIYYVLSWNVLFYFELSKFLEIVCFCSNSVVVIFVLILLYNSLVPFFFTGTFTLKFIFFKSFSLTVTCYL